MKASLASRPGAHAGEHHVESAERLLQSVGSTVRVREEALDAVTGVSGSGPAYFALVAESMIEAGLLVGLSRDVATELVVHTMFGTAKMLRDEGMHPVELREAVHLARRHDDRCDPRARASRG